MGIRTPARWAAGILIAAIAVAAMAIYPPDAGGDLPRRKWLRRHPSERHPSHTSWYSHGSAKFTLNVGGSHILAAIPDVCIHMGNHGGSAWC